MRRMAMVAAIAAALQIAPPAGQAIAAAPARAAMAAGPTRLGGGSTTVRLCPARNARSGPSSRSMLVITGLRYDAPPGVLYEVYLQGAGGRRALVGVINFFNETAGGYGDGPARPQAVGNRTFDATEALRRLGGSAAALVFEPTAGITGPGARARANPGANMRFQSATLRIR